MLCVPCHMVSGGFGSLLFTSFGRCSSGLSEGVPDGDFVSGSDGFGVGGGGVWGAIGGGGVTGGLKIFSGSCLVSGVTGGATGGDWGLVKSTLGPPLNRLEPKPEPMRGVGGGCVPDSFVLSGMVGFSCHLKTMKPIMISTIKANKAKRII